MSADYYFTIEKETVAEYKDRGSRFIAFAFPTGSADEFKRRLRQLKDEHPKAAHHCFAYRLGTDGNQFRSSDDGEPPGTAGKPILGQIDSRQLTNLTVIVIRYFGGTLLGVPGLINAYKTATSLALQTVPIIKRPVEELFSLQFDYTCLNDIMIIIRKYDCSIKEKTIELFCTMQIGVPKVNAATVVQRFRDVRGVDISTTPKSG